jgi:hypothetical protein
MAVSRKEKVYERYAWVILFVFSAFWVFRGLAPILVGGSFFDSGLLALTRMNWNQIVA